MAVGSRYYVDEGGAAGNGSTDDASAINAVLAQAATDGAPVIFGPKTYGLGARLVVPEGVTCIFEGSVLQAISGMPTSGDTSCLIDIDGTNASSKLRGACLKGMCDFNCNGIADYGILLGNGDWRRYVMGHPFRFSGSFISAVRMYSGGSWATHISGCQITSGQIANNGVGFDLQDTNGTTLSIRDCGIGMDNASGAVGFRLEGETIEMATCWVDGTPSNGIGVELMGNNIGTQVEATNMHFEGLVGLLVKVHGENSNNSFKMRGGLVHAPSEHTGTLFDVESGAHLLLDSVRYRAFTNWSTFANNNGQVEVREGTRDLTASTPWSNFTGAGTAWQIWEGTRKTLQS